MSTLLILVKQGKEGGKEEEISCFAHTARETATQWRSATRSMAIQDQTGKEVDQRTIEVQTILGQILKGQRSQLMFLLCLA